MENLGEESDSALRTNNGTKLRLLFKVYAYLFQEQLPFVHKRRLHDVFVQAVAGNRQEEARLANNNDRINYGAANRYFAISANALNDAL